MVSKLLEVLAVREMASLLGDTKSKSPEIIINCLTPGACRSDFDRESAGIRRFMNNIMAHIIGRSTEAGSKTLVAGVAEGEESNGSYMENCRVTE
jgi:retinol dehydrogenase-12